MTELELFATGIQGKVSRRAMDALCLKQILEALRDAKGGGLTAVELSRRTGLILPDTRHFLSYLRDKKLVRKSTVFARKDWPMYSITLDGMEALEK